MKNRKNTMLLFLMLGLASSVFGTSRNKDLQTLGLNKNATVQEIRKAYKKLALKWHPDKNRGNEKKASNMFKMITEAKGRLESNDYSENDEIFADYAPPTKLERAAGRIAIICIVEAICKTPIVALWLLKHETTQKTAKFIFAAAKFLTTPKKAA